MTCVLRRSFSCDEERERTMRLQLTCCIHRIQGNYIVLAIIYKGRRKRKSERQITGGLSRLHEVFAEEFPLLKKWSQHCPVGVCRTRSNRKLKYHKGRICR